MISNTVPVELVDIDLPLCLVDTRVLIRCVLKSWSAFSKSCLDDSQIGGWIRASFVRIAVPIEFRRSAHNPSNVREGLNKA